MTSAPTLPPTADARPPDADGPPTVRFALKPEGPVTGYVDGGWWPRSRNLEAELPALVDALRDRLGPIETVSYHLGDWDSPPRRVAVDGGIVRLGGYRLQHAGSIDVIAHHHSATLVVVGPEQSDGTAQDALDNSAEPGNTDDVETLLAHVQQIETEQKEDRT